MAEENLILLDVVNKAIQEALSNLHTCAIAKITSVGEKTINCQPVVNRLVNGESIALPEFVDVPPIFLCGGSSYEAYPLDVGDYCFLFFTERASDDWYAGRDFETPIELRMHDYSDSFALVGLKNGIGAIDIPDVIKQVGDKLYEGNLTHTGDANQTGDVEQTGNHIINGNLTINGSLSVNASAGDTVTINGVTITVTNGDIIVDGISSKNHNHSGDSGGTTGSPQ